MTWSHHHSPYQVEIPTQAYSFTVLNSTEQNSKPTRHRFSPDVGRGASGEGGPKSIAVSPSPMPPERPPHLRSGSSSPLEKRVLILWAPLSAAGWKPGLHMPFRAKEMLGGYKRPRPLAPAQPAPYPALTLGVRTALLSHLQSFVLSPSPGSRREAPTPRLSGVQGKEMRWQVAPP